MKNKFLTKILFVLACTSIASCAQEKLEVKFNILTKETTATEILKYEDLASMLSLEGNENFIMATYSSQSKGCSCWTGLKFDILDKYVKETSLPIYYFDTDKLTDKEEKFGIKQLVGSSPELYVFKNNKIVKKFKQDSNPLKDYSAFKKKVESFIVMPNNFNLYYVSDDYLDSHLNSLENAVLLIKRNGCGDCSYVLPHTIIPESEKAQFNTEIFVLDIQSYRNNEEVYNQIKAKYQMTEASNTTFGYDTGSVPMIQKYENGTLKDAAVYFNDSISEVEGVNKITKTYYTEERVNNLSFLKNSTIETKVLMGLTVPETDLAYGGSYWKQEAAAKYHDPIVKEFLKTYCL